MTTSAKITLRQIAAKYHAKQKLTMLTCYDATSSTIIDQSHVDMILVGDSVAMVCHGFPDTTHATLDMMVMHTQAVCRVNPRQLIVADMPFLSYRKSLVDSMNAVDRLMKAGANAIKLEGVDGNEELISHLVSSGIPVMGHIGLMPQSINQMGGFVIQGRTHDQQERLRCEAKKLEQLGCFAIVFECIPSPLASQITTSLGIPTIGIGAGPDVDGQVLVLHDLLGMSDMQLKFVKANMNGKELMLTAINDYCHEVEQMAFPLEEHCYHD